MKKIAIVAESGADLSPEMRERYGIYVLPMHVLMGDVSLNDGEFPASDIFDYYEKNKRVPLTSAVNPEEYREMYQKMREENPGCEILHLCYSAVTTATWQNSIIGSEGLEYVTHVDTKCVSGGYGNIVLNVAAYQEKHPEITVKELAAKAEEFVANAKMMFIPDKLDYLLAGGRLTNMAYTVANILNIKPVIEINDGYLVSTKRYRGSVSKLSLKLVKEMTAQYEFENVFLLYTEGISKETREAAEQYMREQGYADVYWVRAGCVISTHGGPGAFGVGGVVRKEIKAKTPLTLPLPWKKK